MKHNWKVTVLLLTLFLIAQYVGMYINAYYFETSLPYGITKATFHAQYSYIELFIYLLFGFGLGLLLAKFSLGKLWKIWFFIAVVIGLVIGFSAFIPAGIAFILAVLGAFFKIVKPNIYVHNFTELFLYGGIMALFSSSLTLFSVSILLILISFYDMWAVWKSKSMIFLAKFQTKLKVFGGFLIPYKKKQAILGGGDVAFTLLFNSVTYFTYGWKALILPLIVGLSLFFLFYLGKKNKFYPAMPFLTTGCFIGLGIVKFLL